MPTKAKSKYLGRCFVIQPFNAKYDKLFKDVFAPAIKAARLEPYRVDNDPQTDIPIEQIEKSITESLVCFAEITTDNPNVWYELGYAIAAKKRVCLVCSSERKTPYPFDIQHRHIIEYPVRPRSGFQPSRNKIKGRLAAIIAGNIEDAGGLRGLWLSSWPPSPHDPSRWVTERVKIEERSGELILKNSRNSDQYQWECQGKLHERNCFLGTFHSVRPGATTTGVLMFYVLPQGDAIAGSVLCPDSKGQMLYSAWLMGRNKRSLDAAKNWLAANSTLLSVKPELGTTSRRRARATDNTGDVSRASSRPM